MPARDPEPPHDPAHVAAHFGEQDFSPRGGRVQRVGDTLPPLVWDNADIVARVLSDTTIPTRWFDDGFNEVTVAARPGIYYAYGEAPAPSGPPMRRAMTCLCFDADATVGAISIGDGLNRPELPDWHSADSDVLAYAHRLGFLPVPESNRRGQLEMDNATQHVQLKRKLLGLAGRQPVVVAARAVPGEAAPVLHDIAAGDAPFDAARLEAIHTALDRWYAQSGSPFAVVIAHRGAAIVSRAFGSVRDKPTTVNTPMLLHSAMKPLLGLHLAMYVDRGVVELDESIGRHLPDFASEADKLLTFRAGHVHVSGIEYPWPLAFSRLAYFRTWQDALIAHCPREWAPGAAYRYGVVGIILAVRALELLCGRNYWDAMERDLFAPMGIRDMWPGGTGFSAQDMARIGVLMANRGRYGKLAFFSEDTWRAILPRPLRDHFPGVDGERGIGFHNCDIHLEAGSIGHSGGCGTQLIVRPDEQLVFAMARNARGEGYDAHLAAVLQAVRACVKA